MNQKYRYEVKGTLKKIIAICVFQKGILPAWEDEKNKAGGDFNVLLKNSSEKEVKKYWNELTLRIISGELMYAETVILM